MGSAGEEVVAMMDGGGNDVQNRIDDGATRDDRSGV